MGESWGVLAAKTDQERKTRFFETPLGANLAASWAVLAAPWGRLGGLGGLLGPSWARLGSRNQTPSRPNIDPKIDQNFDAFGDQLFEEFSWIFLPKMKPRCLPKPLEIDVDLENLFFQKTLFFQRKNNDFCGSGSPT